MRLAHFSDLHLRSLEGAKIRDFFNKRLVGGLNLLLNRGRQHRPEILDAMVEELSAEAIDHILCTGDVTNLALDAEFDRGRACLDRLAAIPIGITCVPGNHDVYVRKVVGRFEELFAPYCAGDPQWQWSARDLWPIVRVHGRLAIVGLSSCLPTAWFTAHGCVGSAQLERLETVLADPRLESRFRVLLLHHPPAGKRASTRFRGLRDYRELSSILERTGVELVLHGHEHLEMEESLSGPNGVAIPVHGVSSCSFHGRRPGKRQARYCLYTLDCSSSGRPVIAARQTRIWDPKTGRFAPVPDCAPADNTATP
ncbi:MAG: metallophosphoesterase [Pseudomonadota bacterium]